ncbi:MAG: hypothetical protein Cons2KO_28570 [Congregibacter sp.]
MSRNFDHTIVSVQNLDTAADAYRRLGFSVMPRSVHENLGTANHIIQFHNNYFELLGDFHNYRDTLMRDLMSERFAGGDGLAMLSLNCTNIVGDRDRLGASGYAPGVIHDSSRKVAFDDGRIDATASRSMINWRDSKSRRWGSLFYTQHDKPETIWFAPWQEHANSVYTLIGISYCSNDFIADAQYISDMFCSATAEQCADRMSWVTPRNERLELLTPRGLSNRFVTPVPKAPFGIWPVALRYAVASLDKCKVALRSGDVPFEEKSGVVTVAAHHASGVLSEFCEL